jgi:hypothetical protein
VILGTGYTGRRIYFQARQAGWKTFATSRNPDVHLSGIPKEHRLLFDLARSETWPAIPAPAHLIWCFPAAPLGLVQDFFAGRPKKSGRILVLGSTSAYGTAGGIVTEQSPLHHHLPRVQGEEFLRQERRAVVIRLSGLYGPGRNVLDWIRKGKIRNTPKWVNLLHVEDAAGICLRALERAQEGTTYLASDGQPRTWAEIVLTASAKWHIPIPPPAPLQEAGKQICIRQLLADLHYPFRYPDLYQALAQLKEQPSP